jgi:tetratricopeptide (TPR) repeat protein
MIGLAWQTSAHVRFGNALWTRGDVAGAIVEYRKAIRLNHMCVEAHYKLGSALRAQGDLAGAIAEYRTAIELMPRLAEAHNDLGNALRDQGDLAGAIAEYHQALRLKPNLAEDHNILGNALRDQGDLAGAIAEYHQALRLKPDLAEAHNNLGDALWAQRDLDRAIAEYREALRLKPDLALAHCKLGAALRENGEYAESLAEYRRGHELGSKRRGWSYPSAAWIREGERFVSLSPRLPAVLKGDDRPVGFSEGLAFAAMAYHAKRYTVSVRLYAEALEADPKRAATLMTGDYYSAACSSALASTGKGDDDPPADEPGRAKLRQQARDWLWADLVLRRLELDTGTDSARRGVRAWLQHWKIDPDLAGIGDREAIDKLPDEERPAWRDFWSEVDTLLAKAGGNRP